MNYRSYKLLFLCWDNATYSPFAESIMKKWSDDQIFIYTAGVSPAGNMHPALLNMLSGKALPHPDYAPRSLDFPGDFFDYIFLLDERITPRSFELGYVKGAVIIDWRLPAPMSVPKQQNDMQRWAYLKEFYKELEHRIRLLTCTLYASLDRNLIRDRILEIARFNSALKQVTGRQGLHHINRTIPGHDPLEQSKSPVIQN